MADIKVEKQGGNAALWWLLAALVVAGILAFTLFDWGDRRTAAGLYDPAQPVAAVVYEGDRWVPRGEAVAFPENQMTVVGQSQEGYNLYANTEQGFQGGGGGEITPGTEPQAYGRVYLRTTEGEYIPLFIQSELE